MLQTDYTTINNALSLLDTSIASDLSKAALDEALTLRNGMSVHAFQTCLSKIQEIHIEEAGDVRITKAAHTLLSHVFKYGNLEYTSRNISYTRRESTCALRGLCAILSNKTVRMTLINNHNTTLKKICAISETSDTTEILDIGVSMMTILDELLLGVKSNRNEFMDTICLQDREIRRNAWYS